MQFCIGGVDILMASGEVFPCTGILGFLSSSEMKRKMLGMQLGWCRKAGPPSIPGSFPWSSLEGAW